MQQKKYFSEEERRAIISSYKNGNNAVQISKVMGFNIKSVRSITRRFTLSGQTRSGNINNSRPKILNEEEEKTILGWVDARPELTLREYQNKVQEEFNKTVSVSTIDRMFKNFSYTLKNLVLVPSRRNSQDVIEQRFIYAQEFGNLMENIDDENKIFFIDEVGFQISMRTKRGRSLVGTVAYLTVPVRRTKNLSVCAIMSKNGLLYKRVQDRRYNSETFYAFMNDFINNCCNGNNLNNCVFIADNARFHQTAQARELFTNHRLVFLPAYSPFLNPIENVFSKWKNHVNRSNCQNESELLNTINSGFLTVTSNDCNGFFRKMQNYLIKACLRQVIND